MSAAHAPGRVIAVAAAVLAAACTTADSARAPGGVEVALHNPGFEQEASPGALCAPQWGCSAHAGVESFRFTVDDAVSASGRRSLRIERVGAEPWGLVTQAVEHHSLKGAVVRFSIAVRTEGATGNGGGPFVLAQGPGGATIAHDQKLASGTTGWTRMTMEFTVPAATTVLEVGAVLEGPGKVWIDDARLERLEPRNSGKNPV